MGNPNAELVEGIKRKPFIRIARLGSFWHPSVHLSNASMLVLHDKATLDNGQDFATIVGLA